MARTASPPAKAAKRSGGSTRPTLLRLEPHVDEGLRRLAKSESRGLSAQANLLLEAALREAQAAA